MSQPVRTTIHKRLAEEWGPIVPTPPLATVLPMLVEHEQHMKRRFKALSSPIEARNALFDRPSAVCELDESFKCFADNSRYFRNPPAQIERDYSLAMCKRYGDQIEAPSPLGFGDCELLLGFEHNIPNNTLPIIWSEGAEDTRKWTPAFRRYRKGLNW